MNQQGGSDTEPTRICVTGSECTGKTSLARALGYHLAIPWVPEAARLFAEQYPGPLGPQTVHSIAELHLALATYAAHAVDAAADPDTPTESQHLIILDTDLISTVVYARHYYGGCPPWIEIEARHRRAELYLLCASDIPWQADGIRDLAADRDAVQDKFRATLDEFGCHWIEVRGDHQQRCAIAIDAIASLQPA